MAIGYFAIAGALGLVHAAFSGYWAAGGRWMLNTVGSFATEWVETEPQTARTALLVLTLLKLAAAILPALAYMNRPRLAAQNRTRLPAIVLGISWPGSVLLILWGGTSFVGAVIGLIASDENRSVKYGHLFFDGIFLLWGATLLTALILSRKAPYQPR
ncbi:MULTISPECIES: DUF3995 domain-containing protein [Rhodococcus]|uniref:DUF3995 domain-containing protein n=2 Tax=Rhodococcus TaxID=1827 RepID=A0ABU4B347_9NOCA|nr:MULTISPECIES: DUF3995 domain-containing protein [Rhodococcus]MDV6232896.1 DUF3995 domain-containing protein [Rhodococcus cercidiphylli]MDV6304097.1 DUF3995 domain-containing protein [Rhodococcus cerastii]MDV7990102.1 DUF3995 domain-containing protein [Rhodococcus sp. IEGM 1374]MDV8056141.1 DUF3995 domain-containing protein [Rhodococcus sp. IEGM 1343]